MLSRVVALSLCLAAGPAVGCDASGAFGVRFGSTVAPSGVQTLDPQLLSPWHKAWIVNVPQPALDFDTYIVRALEEDRVVYEIIALRRIEPGLVDTDDYAKRLEPATREVMLKISQEKGLSFRSAMRGWYDAEDAERIYEVRHYRGRDADFLMVGCTDKKTRAASVAKGLARLRACEEKAKSPVNKCLLTGAP